jgi:hypothetical protein
MRFLTRDRLGDESDGDEEADLGDRQGERPQRLVVVMGGCLGVQLVRDPLPGRIRGEDGLHEFQRDPFGIGATATGDGGGLVRAVLRPIEGAEQIARFFAGRASAAPNLTVLERTVNGQPGLVAQLDGTTVAVYAFDVAGHRIKHTWAVLNPDKLRPWTTG